MFCCQQSCRLIVRNSNVLRIYTSVGHRRHYFSSKIKFFAKILEFPTSSAARIFLQKNDGVKKMEQADVFNSFKYLTGIGITIKDIRRQPNILCVKHTVLRNRHEVLTECGCTTANIFLTICSEPERSLKKVGIICNDIDMQQRLADCLNVKLIPCGEDKPLTAVRTHILRLYFLQNDLMSADEFDTIMNQQQHVRHKSIQRTKAIIDLLTNEFNIPAAQIKDNLNMFHADPDNLRQLLTIGSIGGVNMTEIIRHTPGFMFASYETVKKTLAELKKFGITEESIAKCFRVLGLDSKFVRKRLAELKSSKELNAMNFHPSVLRLVVNKFKAQSRLDYLNELDKKCYNMSALTGNLNQFQKFTANESDKHIPRDCVLFLAKNLQMDAEAVKSEISRHPYWLYIPFAEMKQTIDMLKRAGFRLDDICANMHIVLYAGECVLNRLKVLNETEQIEGHDTTKAMQLKLILYQIESEFNFSGDGVWLDRKSNLNFE